MGRRRAPVNPGTHLSYSIPVMQEEIDLHGNEAQSLLTGCNANWPTCGLPDKLRLKLMSRGAPNAATP